MKFQSILTKSLAAAALTATGLVALNSQNTNDAQAATIVQNDTNVVTINNANSTVAVWDGIENANFTGKELVHGTTWKVVRTAYDVMGNKWYDLGANQWIMAKYTVEGGNAASAQVATPVAPQAQTTVQAPVQKQETTQVQQQNQLLLQLHNKLLHNKLLKYKLQYKSNKLLYKLLRLTTTTMYNVLTQLLYNNKELTAMLQHKSKLLK